MAENSGNSFLPVFSHSRMAVVRRVRKSDQWEHRMGMSNQSWEGRRGLAENGWRGKSERRKCGEIIWPGGEGSPSALSTTRNNMASSLILPEVFAVICFFFMSVLQPVEAYDGGDAAALLLGMAITVVGLCACLGWYSRRRSVQFWYDTKACGPEMSPSRLPKRLASRSLFNKRLLTL